MLSIFAQRKAAQNFFIQKAMPENITKTKGIQKEQATPKNIFFENLKRSRNWSFVGLAPKKFSFFD
jgi:hypothetical protein